MIATGADHVDKVIFDLACDSQASARQMQSRISAFCRDYLALELDQALQQFDGAPDIVLERIELDLGPLAADVSDYELRQRLSRALADGLPRPAAAGAGGSPPASPELRRVLAFFVDGVQISPPMAPDLIIDAALRAGPAALAASIHEWGVRHASRVRLSQALSEAARLQLLHLLAHRDAGLVEEYLNDLYRVHRHSPIVDAGTTGFACVMWELVFTHLLVDRGSHFNTTSFIGATLRRLASRYHTSYEALLEKLAQYVAALPVPPSTRYSLPQTLAVLAREAGAPVGVDAPAQVGTHARLLRALSQFLQHGALGIALAPGASMSSVLLQLAGSNPDDLCLLVRRLGKHASARMRMSRAFEQAAIAQLVALLEPAEGSLIVTHVAQIRLLHERRPIVPEYSPTLLASLWEFVFTYLLVERGSNFNTMSFVASLLQQMAARHGVQYQVLLHDVLAMTAAGAGQGESSLGRIVRALAAAGRKEAVHAGTADAAAAPSFPGHEGGLIAISGGRLGTLGETSAANLDLAQYEQEAQLRFLESGLVPTQAGSTARRGMPGRGVSGSLIDRPEQFAARLREMADHCAVARRVVRYVPAAQRRALVRTLAPAYAGLLESILLAATAAASSLQLTASQRQRFLSCHWEHIVRILLEARASAWQGRRLLDEISAAVVDSLGLSRSQYVSCMREAAQRQSQVQARFEPLLDLLAQQRDGAAHPAAAARATPSWAAMSRADKLPVGERFHVPNSGLVILAQFFQPYFSMLGMLDGRSFASPAHQQRAVHLLQYLASGSIAPDGHELLLNKLLCGLAPTAEVDPAAPVTEREEMCSAQLINTVCQHWSAMKNTGPALFREMFMMRAGALVRNDEDWALAIVPDRFDVLLGSVKWSLSVVRLSWMEGALWVRWK